MDYLLGMSSKLGKTIQRQQQKYREIARCKRVMCLDELRVVALYFRCLTMDGFLIALVISRMILFS